MLVQLSIGDWIDPTKVTGLTIPDEIIGGEIIIGGTGCIVQISDGPDVAEKIRDALAAEINDMLIAADDVASKAEASKLQTSPPPSAPQQPRSLASKASPSR